jgi:hypothetical protein
MLRRSRFIPALAVAACGLLAAASCSAAAPPSPVLGFGDARHGWLVFGGVTWRTSDGGASWIRG